LKPRNTFWSYESLSFIEAELVALDIASLEAKCLQDLLINIPFVSKTIPPILLYYDSCVIIAKVCLFLQFNSFLKILFKLLFPKKYIKSMLLRFFSIILMCWCKKNKKNIILMHFQLKRIFAKTPCTTLPNTH
jgi:hypothetical protein